MAMSWMPMCLVPACDLDRAEWPMALAVMAPDLTVTRDGAPVALDRLAPQILAAISLSEAGAATLARLDLRHLRATPGDLPALWAQLLTEELTAAQARNVKQLRELAQLRHLSETSLQHFERLEAFVWQTTAAERHQVTHLPLADAVLDLTGVDQRLPSDSVGLCDLAVFVQDAGRGVLTATLRLLESDQVVGQWQVMDPGPGWLRLALPRALPMDAQTAILRLDWQGDALSLGLSHPHPDPRFQAHDSRPLALRLWKFVPGTLAPMAPDAHGPGLPKWLVSLDALREAAALAADPERVEVLDWAKGLVLRPAPGQTIAVRLPDFARPGMARLQGMVSVLGADALADLAYAVDDAPQWQRLTAAEPGQLHARFAPLTQVQDLILMARVPDDAASAAVVIFEPIEAFASDV